MGIGGIMTRRPKKRSKPNQKAHKPVPNAPYNDLLRSGPNINIRQLRNDRQKLIEGIGKMRGRPLVVFATTSIPKGQVPNYLNREDLVPLSELFGTIDGDEIDILLETPGGLAEVAIEVVNLLRPRFRFVGFVVPHVAMSAGTMLAMSGNEILMDFRSSLGPIDPQFAGVDGKPIPAQAIVKGVETIREQVDKEGGRLHPVFAPILRNVDPGKYQFAINASQLSIELVQDWLARYKFHDWTTHNSSGRPVTGKDREERAGEIASVLCKNDKWLSHGRPIKIDDLRDMKLQITDFGGDPPLQDLIWKLWTNLYHLLGSTDIYKVFESAELDYFKIATRQSQMAVPPAPGKGPRRQDVGAGQIDLRCSKCGMVHKLQANFKAGIPLAPGAREFPKNARLTCQCGEVANLEGAKLALEAEAQRPIIFLGNEHRKG